jgi:hypothetical protein
MSTAYLAFTVYLAFNLHANTTTFGWMDAEGTYRDENPFDTSASRMIRHVADVPANKTVCTVEEGPLAGWAARTLHEHVDKLLVFDPRENDSISDAIHKGDGPDTYQLCRLLRLGELKAVYHPKDDRRAVFKTTARHYLDLRDRVRATKQKITAAFQRWGARDGASSKSRESIGTAKTDARAIWKSFPSRPLAPSKSDATGCSTPSVRRKPKPARTCSSKGCGIRKLRNFRPFREWDRSLRYVSLSLFSSIIDIRFWETLRFAHPVTAILGSASLKRPF